MQSSAEMYKPFAALEVKLTVILLVKLASLQVIHK